MATVNCPKCAYTFDPTDHKTRFGGAAAGAGAGALIGSKVGLALGPWGAIAGTIPGAIIGGGAAYLGISKVSKCPNCKKRFTI